MIDGEPLVVVYDACILYSNVLTDLFVRVALEGLVRPHWSERIHEEWIANLLRDRPDLTRAKLDRRRALMERALPSAMVERYEHQLAGLVLPDPDDRHVLAVAIEVGAGVIVTANTSDFPASATEPYGVIARDPDDLLCELLEDAQDPMLRAIRAQRTALRDPEQTVDDQIAAYARSGLSSFSARLHDFRDST